MTPESKRLSLVSEDSRSGGLGAPSGSVAPDDRTRRILFALSAEGQPTESLKRAFALSRILGAEMHILRVMPEFSRLNLLLPHANAQDSALFFVRMWESDQETRDWFEEVLGEEIPEACLRVCNGGFVSEVAARAAQLGAELIVVPPREGRFRSGATAIARAAQLPVLVARAATTQESIIAATDLERADYPVLTKAAQLGQRLNAPVVAVHNVDPAAIGSSLGFGWKESGLLSNGFLDERRRQLVQASGGLHIDAEAVLAAERNPADVILREAQVRDADMVVVGVRRRSWFERLTTDSCAAQVVRRSRRSVLVTPLGTPRLEAPGNV